MNSQIEINDVPQEILIEIFKLISFEDLHYNVKLVCKRWHKLISFIYRYPITFLINEETNPNKASLMISKFGKKISTLTLSNVNADVLSNLYNCSLLNLKELIVKWKWTRLGDVHVSVPSFNRIIDQCPKLRSIKIRECFFCGNTSTLFEKIKEKRISKFTFINKYLVVDGLVKLYDLKNMEEFRVFSHFFCEDDITIHVDKFCRNNKRTLKSFGLRTESWMASPEGDDIILRTISTCTMLTKLNLAGCLKVSFAGLTQIANLPKLRCFKIEINSISKNEFVKFFNHTLLKKLHCLGVFWGRRVSIEELQCLDYECGLQKLSMSFVDNQNYANLISAAILKILRKNRQLRKLKLESIRFSFLEIVTKICSAEYNLFYITITQSYYTRSRKKTNSNLKKQLNLISLFYNYEFSIYETELEIMLTKKIG